MILYIGFDKLAKGFFFFFERYQNGKMKCIVKCLSTGNTSVSEVSSQQQSHHPEHTSSNSRADTFHLLGATQRPKRNKEKKKKATETL